MCDLWIEKHASLHQNTLTREATPIRQLAKYMNGTGKAAYVVPVIFRLMYCCGLRESEALNLSVSDVSLENGRIAIRESKGWKARNVFMSDELLTQCRKYDAVISKTVPLQGSILSQQIWKSAQLPYIKQMVP